MKNLMIILYTIGLVCLVCFLTCIYCIVFENKGNNMSYKYILLPKIRKYNIGQTLYIIKNTDTLVLGFVDNKPLTTR